MATKYYAFVIDRENTHGIVLTWDECQIKTKGKGARYKSFKTHLEALEWIKAGGIYEDKKAKHRAAKDLLEDEIYFDAGTGRGIGVEVRVTNKNGDSLLDILMPEDMINEFGNYLAPKGSTNNYGELIGVYLAIDIAIKKGKSKIFGDSKLVIDYWSKGLCNKTSLNEKTINLIQKTSERRVIFEKLGGEIKHVSGDINPADLGFHK
ncbi:ribonuclease H family protein [uncultured Cetobacterium sp.]|uniref:ribonuclease H family protein n=1 Tax=uncultured Cetobacterium sp. TaxID=527638 RepID=UPI002631863C|nr:ribonuclease H family protein [uncultured Cetobacterium sp.]